MQAITVKRFIRAHEEGGRSHYSIRRRSDGSFQLFHDDPYLGISQPYEFDDIAISGLFADLEAAEKELCRICSGLDSSS